MIDIVGFIISQDPVASMTAAQKQAILDRFCRARGYVEESGQTKKEFMNQDICQYIKTMFDADAKKEATRGLIYDTLEF